MITLSDRKGQRAAFHWDFGVMPFSPSEWIISVNIHWISCFSIIEIYYNNHTPIYFSNKKCAMHSKTRIIILCIDTNYNCRIRTIIIVLNVLKIIPLCHVSFDRWIKITFTKYINLE